MTDTTPNDETTPTPKTAKCPYCGDAFAAERAEIGYNYCMKKACTDQGKKDKGIKPIEFSFTEADTARF